MPKSRVEVQNAMWCDRQKMANLINQTVSFMGEIAKKDGARKKSHNSDVDEWIRATQQKVNETITFEYAQNIGILAKFIRSSGPEGWVKLDDNEYLVLKKVLLNPEASEVNKGDIDGMMLQLSEFKRLAAERVKPKEPKPNDIMAVALFSLTFGEEMAKYEEKFKKPVVSSARRGKREATDDKAQKRNEMISQLIENLFQALAVASTPLGVLEGDEIHNKERTSSTDLQIQTIANGLSLIAREIARTKKSSDKADRQAHEVEKASTQFTSQFSLKVREELLAKKDKEIQDLNSELASKVTELERAKEAQLRLEGQVRTRDTELREKESTLQQLTIALEESRASNRQITDQLERLQGTVDSLEIEKQKLVSALEQQKRAHERLELQFNDLTRERAKLQEAHEGTKLELEQEKQNSKGIIEALEMKVAQLQQLLKQTEEKLRQTISRLMPKPEVNEETVDDRRLTEALSRLQEENRLLRNQLNDKNDDISSLQRRLEAASTPRDAMTNTASQVSEEQVSQLIDDIINHHKKVSSQRKNIFGRMFKGVHVAKRENYFNAIEKLKHSKISTEDKLIQVNELTEDYVKALAKGKSVRYLSNMIEFLEGNIPKDEELKRRWNAGSEDLPVVPDIKQNISSKIPDHVARAEI